MRTSKPTPAARRTFLKQCGAWAGVSILSAAYISEAVAKMTKVSAHYQVNMPGKPDCDDCKHYIAPKSGKAAASCKLIAGTINPHGWCDMFTAKV